MKKDSVGTADTISFILNGKPINPTPVNFTLQEKLRELKELEERRKAKPEPND